MTSAPQHMVTAYLVLQPEDDLGCALIQILHFTLVFPGLLFVFAFGHPIPPPARTLGTVAGIDHLTLTASRILPQFPSLFIAFGL